MISHVDYSKRELEDQYYENLKASDISYQHRILLNRPLKVIFVLLLTSVVAPLLIYKYIFFTSTEIASSDGYSFGSCLVPRESRLSCGLGDVDEKNCDPQCCYDLDKNVCFHRFPSRFTYVTPQDQEWDESTTLHPRIGKIPYKSQKSVPQVRISFDEISSSHLSFTIYNSKQNTFEGKRIAEKEYSYEVGLPELNIVINKTHGSNSIFSTMRGPFIASDDIWETSFILTDESMYGLGEIPLKANTTKILYNHAEGPSSIPLIFAKIGEEYHGLLVDILEPTQLSVLEDNRIVVRSITKTGLKFHVFVGPRPEDIMRDVTDHIGTYDALEYWMLGAHICNELSADYTTSYKNFEEFLVKSSEESLPFDSHCGVQPIMFRNEIENTSDPLDNESELLIINKKRFVPHVSPHVQVGKNENGNMETADTKSNLENDELITDRFREFLLRDRDGTIYMGEFNNNIIAYPDYENVSTDVLNTLWKGETKIHGLVLENSWPVDQSIKNMSDMYDSLPYFDQTFEKPFEVTPKWNIDRPNGEKYFYEHNAYGNHFQRAFHKISEENLPIWSSSQWMNGRVAVNVQNMDASWANLQRVLTEAALGGISGHRLWTSPVCGDTELFDATSQSNLCTKWYMAATYLPMIKIYSKSVERHPLAFKGTDKNYIFKALNTRISLMPYYFTMLQEGPLLRPMFYQFPTSENLKDLASQFSVGDSLLIVPNLLPGQSHVKVWLPPGTWYELWSGFKLSGKEGQSVTMATTEADLLTLIRGGSIVTLQRDVKPTSEETRLHSGFSLIVALQCDDEKEDPTECSAHGHLYISQDMSIIYRADSDRIAIETIGTKTSLKLLCDPDTAVWAHVIKELYIYGVGKRNNNYDHHLKVTTNIDLCVLESEIGISFSYSN